MICKQYSRKQHCFSASLAAMVLGLFVTIPGYALSLAPEEFKASRQLACILAQQSLGQLSEKEYGDMTHSVLDDFEQGEKDNILAKALGYYDGLMFSIDDGDADRISLRLEDFVSSSTCTGGYSKVIYTL